MPAVPRDRIEEWSNKIFEKNVYELNLAGARATVQLLKGEIRDIFIE